MTKLFDDSEFSFQEIDASLLSVPDRKEDNVPNDINIVPPEPEQNNEVTND